MVSRLLPPFCLLLALTMLISGFVLFSIDMPAETVDLHQARATGNEGYQTVLESRLVHQKWVRRVLQFGLFIGSLLMTILAFLSMKSSPRV